MQCPKCSARLHPTLTKSLLIIDVCTKCKGTWLDYGEINFLVKERKVLEPYSLRGLEAAKEVLQACPKCSVNLRAGRIPGFRYEVEECPSCRGLWLDEHEVKKIEDSRYFRSVARDKRVQLPPPLPPEKREKPQKQSQRGSRRSSFNLPSLGFTSFVVLAGMYAVLFGLVIFLVESGAIPHAAGMVSITAFIALQFLFGPVLLDWSLGLWGSLSWIEPAELPQGLRNFIEKACAENKIPLPKIGIINDGAPQAYTYGRSPASARLVLSRGTLEILEPEELEAVVAHELGHIVHWDFVIMTLAQLVPVLLYHIYRVCRDLARRRSGGKSRKGNQHFFLAAIVAYCAYIISDFLVMFVSRVREYWADKFSVEATQNPNALVRALIKIAYGMVTTPKGNEEGSSATQEIMCWDLWTPWAAYYELQSTHPLTAKRINAIAGHALNMGLEPDFEFTLKKPESYWDDFLKDLIVLCLPGLGALVAFAVVAGQYSFELARINSWDLMLPIVFGMSAGGLLRTLLSYPGGPFLGSSIVSLLKIVKVSPVLAHPVTVRGEIIGRGDPGNIFSEDMVLRDSTGLIFLNYEHGISNLFFALFRLDAFVGQKVAVEGWYRRAPIPYIEVKSIRTSTMYSRTFTCFYHLPFWFTWPAAILALKAFLQGN